MANLSDREEQVLDFMKAVLGFNFPNLDLRNEGEFLETFGLTHVKLLNPLIEFMDKIKLMQSLENAEKMTEAELDELGASYYNKRKTGFQSRGNVIVEVSDLPESMDLVVPSFSIVFRTKSGPLIRNVMTASVDSSNAASYYDANSYTYKIPLECESVDVGTKTNILTGDVYAIETGSIPNFVSCYNETPFVGGVDTESNEVYAARIREEAFAANLGIMRGYKKYINSFADVIECSIVGYGHPLMKRDVIGKVAIDGINFNEGVRDLHWGTKVDAYIRGTNLVEYEEVLQVEKDEYDNLFVKLNKVPVYDIAWAKIFSYSPEYDDPNIQEDSLFIHNYTLVKEEDFETIGTLEEEAKLYLNDNRLAVGRYIRVVYRYNYLIQEIHDNLYLDENRPPTADVKIKEAKKKILYGSMVVRMWSSVGLRDSNKSYVKQKLNAWLNRKRLKDEIQYSDILEPIKSNVDDPGDGIVDYVHLPSKFFLTDNESRYFFYTLAQEKREFLDGLNPSETQLANLIDYYKGSISVQDAFDFLHVSLTDNFAKEGLDAVGMIDQEYGFKAEAVKYIRDIYTKAEMVTKLSPAVDQLEENEYFQLGDLALYEYTEYKADDWKKMLDDTVSIALNGNDELEEVGAMYDLAVYILIVLKMTLDPIYNLQDLMKYLYSVTESTPLEFRYDI